jgi:hypothetical protein
MPTDLLLHSCVAQRLMHRPQQVLQRCLKEDPDRSCSTLRCFCYWWFMCGFVSGGCMARSTTTWSGHWCLPGTDVCSARQLVNAQMCIKGLPKSPCCKAGHTSRCKTIQTKQTVPTLLSQTAQLSCRDLAQQSCTVSLTYTNQHCSTCQVGHYV